MNAIFWTIGFAVLGVCCFSLARSFVQKAKDITRRRGGKMGHDPIEGLPYSTNKRADVFCGFAELLMVGCVVSFMGFIVSLAMLAVTVSCGH